MTSQQVPTAQAGETQSGLRKQSELEVLVRARYPLIYVVTWEEQRLLKLVGEIASRLDKKVFEWSITTGLVPGGTSIQSQKQRDSASQDPLVALDSVIESVEPALYVFKDFHPFLRGAEHVGGAASAGDCGVDEEHVQDDHHGQPDVRDAAGDGEGPDGAGF
jgi:hypothetical protein